MVVVAVGAQKVPFQAVFDPQPPTGGLGAVGVVVVVGAQKVPFQAVFGPQPPTGGLGAVGVVVVVVGGTGQALVTGIIEPFQHVWVAGATGAAGQVPTGTTAPFQQVWVAGAVGVGTVGAGPPFFSQLDCVEPSLHRTAWALGASNAIRPVNMTESARRSDEAALKRFITSSKAGHLG